MMLTAVALLPLFALSAFFSGAETVFFSLTPQQRRRIKMRDEQADALLTRTLGDSTGLFATLLVGNTLVNFAIATLGYNLFSSFLAGGGWWSVPVMTLALLVFGEVTPKRVALKRAEQLAPICVRILAFFRMLFAPFCHVFALTTKMCGPALERERRALSDAEFVSVLEAAAEDGEFARRDAEMIEGVLRLSELSANDEMTPRVDIEGYDEDRPEEYRAEILKKARHRYLPIYRRTADQIEGVLDTETGVRTEALFVPESMPLDDLLVTFAKSKKPLAVVLDEYGGTAGIITPDDIEELILGPCVFSARNVEPLLVKTGHNVWEIDARASIEEVNRALDVELEAGDQDRLAGWVAYHAERLPHAGQQIEADGCRATVLKRRRRRVAQVRLEVLSRPAPETDDVLLAETDEAVEKTEEDDR